MFWQDFLKGRWLNNQHQQQNAVGVIARRRHQTRGQRYDRDWRTGKNLAVPKSQVEIPMTKKDAYCILGHFKVFRFFQAGTGQIWKAGESRILKVLCPFNSALSDMSFRQDWKQLLIFGCLLPSVVIMILKYLNLSVLHGVGSLLNSATIILCWGACGNRYIY